MKTIAIAAAAVLGGVLLVSHQQAAAAEWVDVHNSPGWRMDWRSVLDRPDGVRVLIAKMSGETPRIAELFIPRESCDAHAGTARLRPLELAKPLDTVYTWAHGLNTPLSVIAFNACLKARLDQMEIQMLRAAPRSGSD